MKNGKRFTWIIIIAIIAVLFITTAIRRLNREEILSIDEIQEREGIPVDVVRAAVFPVEEWHEYIGIAKGYDQIDLEVDSRSRVKRVNVRTGDRVSVGSVIVELDPFDPVRVANNLSSAEARYDAAHKDSLRMVALFSAGAVSQQQFDQVNIGAEAARVAYVAAARAVRLDTPISGQVTALYVNAGDYADDGEVVATVANLDSIRIPLRVSSQERAGIEVGSRVRVRIEGGSSTSASSRRANGGATDLKPSNTRLESEQGDGRPYLPGVVSRVALSADTESRLFAVEAVVANPGQAIKPGLLVRVEILRASSSKHPVVPSMALMDDSEGLALYVASDCNDSLRAVKRLIRVGVRNGTSAAVVSGLRPRETVVVRGQNKITDGDLLSIHSDLTNRFTSDSP